MTDDEINLICERFDLTDPALQRRTIVTLIMENDALKNALAAAPRWRDIATAPKDGTEIWTYSPPAHGLKALYSTCAWHPDAGFCVCELRDPTHWMPLPIPPDPEAKS